ncbi:MAG: inorganic pyrophosphatase Ppa [Proteobacteria bacterium]|nr:inorganic pyrophosphatase Ppa [Pseudomonadota bacterium]MBU1717224.1 inorganic pyrophosphatase Ppa [Pseudomonadota bacterium]
MPIVKMLKSSREFEIQTYKKPEDIRQMNLNNVSFSGTPFHHPYNNEKLVLLINPFSSETLYYEFFTRDISFAEHLENIVDPEGKSLNIVRLWVKKKSVSIRCTPFIVDDNSVR